MIEMLISTGEFKRLDLSVDEEEHSIEMQLPFLAKVMERCDLELIVFQLIYYWIIILSVKSNFTVVPIMVGDLKGDKGTNYGKILSPYLEDPENLFVISSDFCHWGRFKKFIIL